jgi:hypothetical protein
MGIFDYINAVNFPVQYPSLHLIIRLDAELGEPGQTCDFTIILLTPDGNQIFDLSGQFQIPPSEQGRMPEMTLLLELNNVVFPQPGPYSIILLIDKDHKGRLTLTVNEVSTLEPSGN